MIKGIIIATSLLLGLLLPTEMENKEVVVETEMEMEIETLYAETGIITEIEYSDYGCLFTVTVANGNQFSYYADGVVDYYLNDLVSMLMDSKGTELVYDDEILDAQYSGVLEHLEQWVVSEEE